MADQFLDLGTAETSSEAVVISSSEDTSAPVPVPATEERVDDLVTEEVAEPKVDEAVKPGVEDVTPASSSSACPAGGCCSFVTNMNPRVRELIYWNNPIESGVFLGVSLVMLVYMCCQGFVNTLSCLGLIVLSLSFALTAVSAVARKALNKDIPNPLLKIINRPMEITDEQVNGAAKCVAASCESACKRLRRLYCIDDIPESFKFGIGLWFVYWITSRIGFFDILLLGEVLIFSVPKLYQVYQVQIDKAVESAKSQAIQALEKAKSSPFVDQVVKVVAPKEKQT